MFENREAILDPDKISDPELIRLTLLLASLYLSAFEILKNSVVQRTADFFIHAEEMTTAEVRRWEALGVDVSKQQEAYAEEVRQYEEDVDTRFDRRHQYALIPSCVWLHRIGVLSEADVEDVRLIREHRNEIAHELPVLLTCSGFEVNIGYLQRTKELLHKIEVFGARSTLLYDPVTLEEVSVDEIPDQDLYSIREAMLDIVLRTVLDHVNKDQELESRDLAGLG